MIAILSTTLLTAQATFSYGGPSLPASKLFELVKDQTSIRVETEGISHVHLYVKVDSVSVPDLVAKVAEVTGASSSLIEGGGYRLSVGKGQLVKFAEAENKSIASGLKWAIDRQKGILADALDWSEIRSNQRAREWTKTLEDSVKDFGSQQGVISLNIGGTMDLPASLVLAKILTTIAPEKLISSDKVFRLSDKPNTYQVGLGLDLSGTYKDFVQANNRLHDLSIPRPSGLELSYGLAPGKIGVNDISKTTVIVARENPSDFGIIVAISDRNGDVLGKSEIRWQLPAQTQDVPSVFGGSIEYKGSF